MNRLLLIAAGLVLLSTSGVRAGAIRFHYRPSENVDPNVLAALVRRAADPNAEVRVESIEDLGRLWASEAWGVIAGHLTDRAVVQTKAGPRTVAAVACDTLGQLGERRAVPHLIPLLEDPDLKDAASRALALLKNVRVVRAPWPVRGPLVGRYEALDAVDPLCGSDPVKWRAWWTQQQLSGREVFVRVYKDPRKEPARFELVAAKVTGESVALAAIPGADPCSVVLICPQDQQNEDLRVMMGRWLVARCVADGKSLSVPNLWWPTLSDRPACDRWMIEDALGDPIRGAQVEVFLVKRGRAGRCTVCLGKWVVPEGGMEAIQAGGGFSMWVEVSHPDYGKASSGSVMPGYPEIRVPLVRQGSEAGERAIWGTVVDESGQAVSGAEILCDSVRTLGEGLIRPSRWGGSGKAITDANGFFALYTPPDSMFAELQGSLVPPGSQYHVTVTPSADSDLAPFEGTVPNGAATRITLRHIDRRARTFVFQTQDGVLQNVELLKRIAIEVQPPGRPAQKYDHARWSAGDAMPEGTYVATLKMDTSALRFEPLLVTQDSPGVLVFRDRATVTYSGQVLHAKTGLPLAGAFVLVETRGGPKRFSDLTDAEWTPLEQLNLHPDADDEALKAVGKVYPFLDVVRTDAAGCYEIRLEGGTDFYAIVYFARDYVPAQCRVARLEPDATGRVEIPPIHLYPAAKVKMYVQTGLEQVRIAVYWRLKEDQTPSWARELGSRPMASSPRPLYSHSYAPNVEQVVFVPAEVPLQLTVTTGPDDRLCPWTYPQIVCLPQGAVMDLGSCSLQESLSVVLQVVDRDGRPLEGVPVKRAMGRTLSTTHNTDENGLATLRVAPHSHAHLGVFPFTLRDRAARRLKPETVAIEVGGVEDEGRQFTLVLSEDLLTALFGDR